MISFLKKCKKSIGYRLHNIKMRHHDPDAEFNAVLKHFLSSQASQTTFILDVGAHRGESVARFKGLFPQSVIHSFEPDKENFAALTEKTSAWSNITLNNMGVGARKEQLTFYRNLKSNTSGLNPINEQSEWAKKRSAQRGVSPAEYTQKSYKVDIIDLDSYIAEHTIDRINLLKVDTQGHEDAVFDGCKNALQNGMIDIIETELIVGDSYTKSMTFSDIENRLLPFGYKFYGIDCHGDLLQTPWLSFNLIYIHKRLLQA